MPTSPELHRSHETGMASCFLMYTAQEEEEEGAKLKGRLFPKDKQCCLVLPKPTPPDSRAEPEHRHTPPHTTNHKLGADIQRLLPPFMLFLLLLLLLSLVLGRQTLSRGPLLGHQGVELKQACAGGTQEA